MKTLDVTKLSLNIADTGGNDNIKGRGGDDVISARNGSDRISGKKGNDLLISYSDAGEPPVLGKQVVNQDEPLANSNDILRGGAGADTFMWGIEIDAKPQFLQKHTQANGRIDGANNRFIDRAGQHHLYSFHGGIISDAQTFAKLGLYPQAIKELCDLGAATVDNHGIGAKVFQQDDIPRESC